MLVSFVIFFTIISCNLGLENGSDLVDEWLYSSSASYYKKYIFYENLDSKFIMPMNETEKLTYYSNYEVE